MFGRKSSKDKKDIGFEIKKSFSKIEETAKQDFKKAENIVKNDYEIVKEDIKKIETKENLNFFITYGWAILIIIVCIGLFLWWQFFSIKSENCEFIEGSGLFCEHFDITNSSASFEIRNLNNKTIVIDQLTLNSCFINPKQNIADNDKKRFNIPCNISSGRLRENLIVAYTIEDFQKHTVAKLTKIVP